MESERNNMAVWQDNRSAWTERYKDTTLSFSRIGNNGLPLREAGERIFYQVERVLRLPSLTRTEACASETISVFKISRYFLPVGE